MKKFALIGGLSLVGLGIISSYGSNTVVAQNSTREILPLQLEEQIPVPSVAGRIDHFSADAKRKRLFVSALGNNSLEVIDVFAGRVVHSIKGLAQPQGPLYVPAVDKLYVANAEDGKVRVYDGATYTLRKTIDFGKDPDNMRYDEGSMRVYVGFGEDDGGIAMIDPKTDERVGDVYKTDGHPESFQVEAKGDHIFVNVPDAGNVVESIDKKTGAVTKWPLKDVQLAITLPLSMTDTSGSIQNAQMPAPRNSRQAAITNGAIHEPRATRIPNTVGDSAPPICPPMFIIPDTVPEYSPPMSIGTAQDGPMIVSRKNIAAARQ
jgi:hypothetical protein